MLVYTVYCMAAAVAANWQAENVGFWVTRRAAAAAAAALTDDELT